MAWRDNMARRTGMMIKMINSMKIIAIWRAVTSTTMMRKATRTKVNSRRGKARKDSRVAMVKGCNWVSIKVRAVTLMTSSKRSARSWISWRSSTRQWWPTRQKTNKACHHLPSSTARQVSFILKNPTHTSTSSHTLATITKKTVRQWWYQSVPTHQFTLNKLKRTWPQTLKRGTTLTKISMRLNILPVMKRIKIMKMKVMKSGRIIKMILSINCWRRMITRMRRKRLLRGSWQRRASLDRFRPKTRSHLKILFCNSRKPNTSTSRNPFQSHPSRPPCPLL